MRYAVTLAAGLLGLLAGTTALRADDEKEIGGKKLKQWTADLRDLDPGKRELALRTLPLFAKEACKKEVVRAILTEFKDQDPSLRVNAVIALGHIGLDSDSVEDGVKALGQLLVRDTQAIVRLQAAMALAAFGSGAHAAIPQLDLTLRDSFNSFEVRKAAAFALRTVAEQDKTKGPDASAIKALMYGLKDGSARVRLEVVISLLFLGKPAQSELLQSEKLALERAFNDRDKAVGLWARVGWMRINKVQENHLLYIGQLLKDRDTTVCVHSAEALGMIGPEAKSQVPRLVEALKDKSDAVVVAAIDALMKMGDEAQRAVPALTQLADGSNEGLKTVAKAALERLSKQAKPKKAAP